MGDVLEKYKPKVIDALNNVKKVVIEGAKKIVVEVNNGIVKIITDGQTATSDDNLYVFEEFHHTAYVVIDDAVPSAYGFKDVWGKIEDKLGEEFSAQVKSLVEKYKPKIIKTLEKVKQFIIEEGKKIIIELQGDLIKIVVKSLTGQIEKRSISDVWAKIKDAAKNLKSNIKDSVTDVLEKYKPKVIDALNNVKKVVIEGAKKIVVEVNNGIVKIITDGQTATSDNSLYADEHHEIYAIIDDDSMSYGYGIRDIWAKVKTAVKDLGDKISKESKELIEKHKPTIIKLLGQVKEIALEKGEKIIIRLKDQLIKIAIEKAIEKIAGGVLVQKRSIRDIWGKIKEAAKNLGDNIQDSVTDVLIQYRPKLIDALNHVKKVVIDAAKQIVIEVNNGIVKIITDGQIATSDDSLYADVDHDIYYIIDDSASYGYGIRDVWGKVKTAVNNLRGDIKAKVMKIVEEYKPKVIQALRNVQQVVIDAGKQIFLRVDGDIVKVIVDGLEGLSN